jgi:hypothetical protein
MPDGSLLVLMQDDKGLERVSITPSPESNLAALFGDSQPRASMSTIKFERRQTMRRVTACIAMAFACLLGGCGSVSGHTYHDNGGVVRVEFKSGGKALVSIGPMSHGCTYSESGKNVSLNCDGEKLNFTMQDDGALAGPPDGYMARLTPVND